MKGLRPGSLPVGGLSFKRGPVSSRGGKPSGRPSPNRFPKVRVRNVLRLNLAKSHKGQNLAKAQALLIFYANHRPMASFRMIKALAPSISKIPGALSDKFLMMVLAFSSSPWSMALNKTLSSESISSGRYDVPNIETRIWSELSP